MFDINYRFLPALKPHEPPVGTFDYYLQGVSDAVGLAGDLLLLKGGIGKLAESSLAESSSSYKFLTSSVGGAATAGTIYGAVFTPVSDKYGSQINSRLKNAVLNGTTFAAMGLAGEGVGSKLAQAELNPIASSLTRFGANAAISVPIGVVSSQAHSRWFDGQWERWDQTKRAALDWRHWRHHVCS